jgi:arylformamidase
MPHAAWIDISLPLRTGLAGWPGDPPIRVERIMDLSHGDPCTLSALSLCAHAGTHLDAPAHYLPGGATMDALPLDAVIGPARIIPIADPQAVTVAELRKHRIRAGQRLLFKTANATRPWDAPEFIEDFVALEKDAADYLAARKVRLVGVDGPSVSGFHDDHAAIHGALLAAGIWILEGLDLSQAPPGPTQLLCLPLRLTGSEAAPVRAFVKRRERDARGATL